MKTPDDIKKALECCSSEEMHCAPEDPKCIYDCGDEVYIYNLMHDALAYIQQLEADNAQQARCIENLTDKLNATNDALPRWISVEEKLPEEKEDVAAIIRWNEDVSQYGIAFMLDGKWLVNGTGRVVVSHWCPLPKEVP